MAANIVKKPLVSKKFFWKWDNLERRLSKALWKFNFVFYGIFFKGKKDQDLITSPLYYNVAKYVYIFLGKMSRYAMLISEVIQVSTWRSPEVLQRGWVPKPGRVTSGIWTRNLPIYLQLLNVATPSELGFLRWFDLY